MLHNGNIETYMTSLGLYYYGEPRYFLRKISENLKILKTNYVMNFIKHLWIKIFCVNETLLFTYVNL